MPVQIGFTDVFETAIYENIAAGDGVQCKVFVFRRHFIRNGRQEALGVRAGVGVASSSRLALELALLPLRSRLGIDA